MNISYYYWLYNDYVCSVYKFVEYGLETGGGTSFSFQPIKS